MIQEILNRILKGELDDKDTLSRDLIILAEYLGKTGSEIVQSQINYARKYQEVKPQHKTDKSCEIAMMLTDEYLKLENKKATQRALLEIIRSVKHRLRILSEETRI